MTENTDADRIPVEHIAMPSWDQLAYSFAQLGPDDRMKVLIQAGICPKPISGLTWGVELQLLKHNRSKWPDAEIVIACLMNGKIESECVPGND